MVLADAFAGIADEAHAPGSQIGEAAEIVEDLAGDRVGVERIDREVAASGDVVTQGGDLDRSMRQHCGHRAVIDAGGNGADLGGGEPLHDGFGQERRGDVDVLDVDAQQGVAHRAADIARLALAQGGHQRAEVLALGPFGWGQALSHASAAGARG
jgi:hypothetical protein